MGCYNNPEPSIIIVEHIKHIVQTKVIFHLHCLILRIMWNWADLKDGNNILLCRNIIINQLSLVLDSVMERIIGRNKSWIIVRTYDAIYLTFHFNITTQFRSYKLLIGGIPLKMICLCFGWSHNSNNWYSFNWMIKMW